MHHYGSFLTLEDVLKMYDPFGCTQPIITKRSKRNQATLAECATLFCYGVCSNEAL